jgi:molybdate transport system substrate-binding protein
MIRLIALLALAMTSQARAAETVILFAAGSLRAPLTEIANTFTTAEGVKVEARYGASGTLKDEITGGARADVFASANMEHPQALARGGKGSPVVLFARNQLCALVRPGIAATPDNLLALMLDPQVRLAASTPRADPSGDYAWEVFHKADQLAPGAFATLATKALQLVGGPNSPTAPPGESVYGSLIAQGQADIFLTYCTNARQAHARHPDQTTVTLPAALAVGADYGLTVLAGATPQAYMLAMFMLTADGQRILAAHGFSAPTLPQSSQ